MATKEPVKDKKDSKEALNTDVKTPVKFKFVEGRLVLYLPSSDIGPTRVLKAVSLFNI